MTKDTVLGIVRTILTLVGTFLIGHNLGFLGALTSDTLQIVIGSALTLGSFIWGIVDKSTGPEQWASALRSVVTSIGGLLIALGKTTGATVEAILGVIAALTPLFQKKAAAETNKQIANPATHITADMKTGKVIDPSKDKPKP